MTVPRCFRVLLIRVLNHKKAARRIIVLMILSLTCAPMFLCADEVSRQHLFKIERSKNANIVQYDAQVSPDGSLLKKKPVVAYWVRLAEQGQVQELSWIQKFVYGFKARFDKSGETIDLDMAVDIDRIITVIRDGDEYRATIIIDGALTYFEKIFVSSSRKGWKITVYYVELYGQDVETGEARYERFVP